MPFFKMLLSSLVAMQLLQPTYSQNGLLHFVFFSQDRENIHHALFYENPGVAGAQITYPWKRLERNKDQYDFSEIKQDLEFLRSKGKKLFIQIQDVTFDSNRVAVPQYLLTDTAYHGGVFPQYFLENDSAVAPVKGGWINRRWDPAVAARFHKLLAALGKELDGKIEGINLAETSIDMVNNPAYMPAGFSFDMYRDAVKENIRQLKEAFPSSVCLQYANFMPGEFLPGDDKHYLKDVIQYAIQTGVGVGGPDIKVNKKTQMDHSYGLIRNAHGKVPTGVAVQDGNYSILNEKTNKQVTVPEILAFGRDYLKLNYIFWCMEEPFYSREVLPMLKSMPATTSAMMAAMPPMGWNSWNFFGKKLINEKLIIEVIDAIDKEGLRTAGYNYVVVDGGWRSGTLGSGGALLADSIQFPHGMKFLANYAHSKGLKFGLHTVPGTHDCGGDAVGGYGHEEKHLQQFIDWGIDFIKLDQCRFKGGWNDAVLKETYLKWSALIKKSKSDILLSISAYAFRDWNPEAGQMARTTEDISTTAGGMSGYHAVFDDSIPAKENKWDLQTVMQIADENNKWAKYARPGFWNDPDMLVTGNQGLSQEEQKSHFALWCIMSAPLMLGNDPRHLTTEEKNIILNKECIRIDQDVKGQGERIKVKGSVEIWMKKLADGSAAVLLLNRSKTKKQQVSFDLSATGIYKNAIIKDIYSKKQLGVFSGNYSASLDPRSGKFLLVSTK